MSEATSKTETFVHKPRVAYFSMEIAMESDIPTYSGGLGVLAGDTLRAAADIGVPMVAVTLVSRAGYFRQAIDPQGRQVELADDWDPARYATRLQATVALELENRQVWVGGWLYVLNSWVDDGVPILLLDTDLPVNDPRDRDITRHLYGGDETYRIKQEAVLGLGGIAMLQALGFTLMGYHMNEGHSAFLTLALLRRYAHPHQGLRPGESPYDLPRVRELCTFTTHTPVEAGHDKFDYGLVRRIYGDLLDPGMVKLLAGEDRLNMTRLALNLSEYVNGVAKRHAEVSRQIFPGYAVHAVTNGVHASTCLEGVTGWAVGDDTPTANGHDAVALYDKLEQVILPLWYEDRPGWTAVMKGAISRNAAYFNSHRMMRRYATEAYLR